MKEERKVRKVPGWALGVLLGVVIIGMVMECYAGLTWVALRHNTTLNLLHVQWPQMKHVGVWSAIVLVGMILTMTWFVLWYEAPGRRWQRLGATCVVLSCLVFGVTLLCCKAYHDTLSRSGIGTMQVALDEVYYQQDMKLMGQLGFYGGQLKVDDEVQIYLCRQMDTFGPFTEPVLADTETQAFSDGYEAYSRFEQDGLVQIHALSVQHYQDGYWLVVKRLVKASDLYIELETLDDLQRYVVQMQYRRHTGSEVDLLREFEEVAGSAVSRK